MSFDIPGIGIDFAPLQFYLLKVSMNQKVSGTLLVARRPQFFDGNYSFEKAMNSVVPWALGVLPNQALENGCSRGTSCILSMSEVSVT